MYFFFAYFLHLQQFSISLKWFLVVNLWALFKGLLGTFQLFLVSPLVLITPLMGLRPSQSIGYSKAWFELKKQSQIICCIGTALKEKHSAESQIISSFADTEEKQKHETRKEVQHTYPSELLRFEMEAGCIRANMMLATANIWMTMQYSSLPTNPNLSSGKQFSDVQRNSMSTSVFPRKCDFPENLKLNSKK